VIPEQLPFRKSRLGSNRLSTDSSGIGFQRLCLLHQQETDRHSEPPLHKSDSTSEALFSALAAFTDYQLNSRRGCNTSTNGSHVIIILSFGNSLLSEQRQAARVASFYPRHSISIRAVPVHTTENGPKSRLAHTLCLEPRIPSPSP
jgi:hypothetical protein